MSELDRYRSWLNPGVASYMKDLTLLELDPKTYLEHPPFKYFLQALQHVPGSTNLVDAGCGVGHYSEVLFRHHPRVAYVGFDFSEAMIEQAQKLWSGRTFFVADMLDFDYSSYDIVLASSLIEVIDDWARGVRAICKTARRTIILNRVRLHTARTVRNETSGYPGQPTYTHVHNESELLSLFEEGGFDVTWSVKWKEYPQATYVFERA
jgi:putative methyltransferase (TIGR04325 family)